MKAQLFKTVGQVTHKFSQRADSVLIRFRNVNLQVLTEPDHQVHKPDGPMSGTSFRLSLGATSSRAASGAICCNALKISSLIANLVIFLDIEVDNLRAFAPLYHCTVAGTTVMVGMSRLS